MSDQITCSDCGGSFVFTDAEREFYLSKDLAVPPKRCKACRQARKVSRGDTPSGGDRRDGPRPSGPRSGDRPPFRGAPRPPFREGARVTWGTTPNPRGGAAPARGPSRDGRSARDRSAPPPRRNGPKFPGGQTPAAIAPKPSVQPGNGSAARPERPKYGIHCATCGIHAQVPFKPLEGRLVYCQPCYRARPRVAPAVSPGESILVGDTETGIVE